MSEMYPMILGIAFALIVCAHCQYDYGDSTDRKWFYRMISDGKDNENDVNFYGGGEDYHRRMEPPMAFRRGPEDGYEEAVEMDGVLYRRQSSTETNSQIGLPTVPSEQVTVQMFPRKLNREYRQQQYHRPILQYPSLLPVRNPAVGEATRPILSYFWKAIAQIS